MYFSPFILRSFDENKPHLLHNGRNQIEKCQNNLGILCIDPSLKYAETFNTIDRDYNIDYFFPNQEEASTITGVSDYKKAASLSFQPAIDWLKSPGARWCRELKRKWF